MAFEFFILVSVPNLDAFCDFEIDAYGIWDGDKICEIEKYINVTISARALKYLV